MLINKSRVEENLEPVIEPGWGREEFKMIALGDKRLDKRFIKVTEKLSAKPLASINQACETWAEVKGAYRLFDNEKVTGREILAVHQAQTVERMKGAGIVLAVQDTTCLNYTRHFKKRGMGSIGTKAQDLQGLWMHSTLALTVRGMPLGFLTQEIWARDKEGTENSHRHKEVSIEEKESYKWLKALEETTNLTPEGVRVITLCDREADIYEFFAKTVGCGSEVLVRAAQNRKLVGEIGQLWDYMNSQPVVGHLQIGVSCSS